MTLAEGPNVQTVVAFIGPLLVGMGLLGGVFAWIVKSATTILEARFRAMTDLQAAQQRNIDDRLAAQQLQISTQNHALQEAITTINATGRAVARIEGTLGSGKKEL